MVSSFGVRIRNGLIAPVKLIRMSAPSSTFSASIIYFGLNEIFNSSPSIWSAITASTTFPISGEFDEISSESAGLAESFTTLLRPSLANKEARSIACKIPSYSRRFPFCFPAELSWSCPDSFRQAILRRTIRFRFEQNLGFCNHDINQFLVVIKILLSSVKLFRE